MPVVVAAGGESRNHGVVQARKHTFALATVVQRVFPEGAREGIARRRSDRGDAEIGSESLAVTRRALLPLWRSIVRLVNASRDGSAHDWIWSKGIEEVVAEPRFLCRTDVLKVRVSYACAGDRGRGVS